MPTKENVDLLSIFDSVVAVDDNVKVVSYGSEEVAEKAIMILKDVFTNLGPRLLANQVNFLCIVVLS